MAGQTMTVANALLKDIYGDIHKQLNGDTPALDGIKSTSKYVSKTGGKGVLFDVHVGRNDGLGARLEDEDLPDPGAQSYAQARTTLKYKYASVGLTAQVMKLAAKDYQSFANVATEEIERQRADIAKDDNRQVFGSGVGVLATIITADTTNTVIEVDTIQYIRGWKNRRIDIVTAATAGTGSPAYQNGSAAIKILSWNKAAGTVTVDTEVAVLGVGDVLVASDRGASAGTNSHNKEWTGLSKIIGTDALHGLDPADEPEWQSYVVDLTSGGNPQPVTEDDLLDAFLEIRESGEGPNKMYTTPRVMKTYWGDLEGKRSYVNKTKLESGMEVPSFMTPSGAVPFLTDYDAPKGEIQLINTSRIQIHTATGWEWIDEDGSKWKWVSKRDKFVAYLRNFSDLATNRRNGLGRIKGIAE